MDQNTERAYKLVEAVWNHMETPLDTLASASATNDGLTATEADHVLTQLRELRRTIGYILMTW